MGGRATPPLILWVADQVSSITREEPQPGVEFVRLCDLGPLVAGRTWTGFQRSVLGTEEPIGWSAWLR
jgi:hypothetical protein